MSLPSQKELNLFRRRLAGFDDAALLAKIRTACDEIAGQGWGSPKTDQIKKMLKPRLELDQFYLECLARGLGNEYANIYSRRLRKHTQAIRVTKREQFDVVRHAHCSYMWPRKANVVEIILAIDRYAESSSSFNTYLRDRPFKKLSEEQKQRIKALDRAMQPLPEEVELYRGFSMPYGMSFPYKAGEIYHDKGFMCTTAKRGIAQSFKSGFLLELIVPAGTPYASTWKGATRNNAYVREEQEIIIGRGRRIYITAIEQKRDYKLVRGRVVTLKEIREQSPNIFT